MSTTSSSALVAPKTDRHVLATAARVIGETGDVLFDLEEQLVEQAQRAARKSARRAA